MKKIYFLIILFANNIIFSQSFCIVDSLTKKGISNSVIKFYDLNNFTTGKFTDENGLTNYNNILFDKIEISHINYKTINLKKEEIEDTIYMNQNNIVLNEVIVVNSKIETLTLGYTKCKKKTKLTAYNGIEIVVFIENPFKKPKKINSFLFKIQKKDTKKTAIRIHFYKKSANEIIPGEEITKVDIFKYINSNSMELIEIDVSNYDLEFPIDGAFVGIEWLGNIGETNNEIEKSNDIYIELNDKINQALTFTRSTLKDDEWQNTKKHKIDFKDFIKYKNLPNASFGIKIIR
ncbi:MAG: hypothetical protein ACOVLC_11925 [Flavobacterium sp.]